MISLQLLNPYSSHLECFTIFPIFSKFYKVYFSSRTYLISYCRNKLSCFLGWACEINSTQRQTNKVVCWNTPQRSEVNLLVYRNSSLPPAENFLHIRSYIPVLYMYITYNITYKLLHICTKMEIHVYVFSFCIIHFILWLFYDSKR